MSKIINLTQHMASAEQVSGGVFEPSDKKGVQALLTFVGIPTKVTVQERANALAQLAAEAGASAAMIGGAPYLMAPLQSALKVKGVSVLYAYSERQSVETTQPDGSVVKTNVFRHVGFYEA